MIGIVNVQWYDNPGAVLLCYALEKTINKIKSEDVVVIDYATGGGNKSSYFSKIFKIPQKVNASIWHRKKINGIRYSKLLLKRHQLFENFRKNHLNRTARFVDRNSEILKESYSHCIVGSDVVWKPEIVNSEHADVYFLNFGDKSMKRISYAASIGTEDAQVLNPLALLYKQQLEKFDYISVRENSAVDFLQDKINIPVEKVSDPVFLLEKEDYDNLIINVHPAIDEKYIYVYLLSYNEEAIAQAKKLAKEKKCKILYDMHTDEILKVQKAFGKSAIPFVATGPLEFLSAIKNAESIVNNSFHGAAFSLILEKDFYTFGKINQGIDISTRMKDLLNDVGLSDRYCDKMKENVKEIDYKVINKKLEVMRNEGINFLELALK